MDEEDLADEKNSHCTQKSELLHQRKRENQEREVAAAASKKCRIFAYSRSLLLQERDIPYQYRRQRFYGLPDLRAEDSSNFCNPGKNTSVHTGNREKKLLWLIFFWVNINPRNADAITVQNVPITVLATETVKASKIPLNFITSI